MNGNDDEQSEREYIQTGMNQAAALGARLRGDDAEPVDHAGNGGAESCNNARDRRIVAGCPEQLIVRRFADKVEDPTANQQTNWHYHQHRMNRVRFDLCARSHDSTTWGIEILH